MARFGFVGPTYASQSVIADCQRTMNWYPEAIESGQGKSQMALYPTPGLAVFATIAKPVRGLFAFNGLMFAVGGSKLYQIGQGAFAGAATLLGDVGNDGNPAFMATNGSAGSQLLVSSAGNLYVWYLATSSVTPGTLLGPLASLQGGNAGFVAFCDGYGVVTLQGTNKFQVSALEDFSTWNPLSVQQVSVFPENIAGMAAAYRQLWMFGQDGHAVAYYNSGANAYTPFDVISGSTMEEGIDAGYSLAVLDNAPFWIGGNANGAGIAWRANGYAPLRISNHAVETAWASYPNKSSDAIGYAYKDQGHTFWVLRFPSANKGFGATWVYDTATQLWHERGFWSQQGPTGYSAHLSTCHCWAFNRNMVGDWQSGNIYAMDIATYQDNGQAIRRFRRAPHISSEQQWIYHHEMQIDMEVGDGPVQGLPDGAGNLRAPQAMLRWSNNGGRTWGNEHWVGVGQIGEYDARARWQRMGRARDRVYELAVTDPIPWRIIEADLRATPGFQMPQERYSKQLAKIT